MLKFLYNMKNKYSNINKYKIELKITAKDFFLESWAKNVDGHYTWKNMVNSVKFM